MERGKKDKEHKFQIEVHLLEEEIKKKKSRMKLNEGYLKRHLIFVLNSTLTSYLCLSIGGYQK